MLSKYGNCTRRKIVFFFFPNIVGQNSRYFVGVFNKTVIPLALVGYEMIIADKALYLLSHIQPALVE